MKIIWTLLIALYLAGCQKTIGYKSIEDSDILQVENTLFDRMLVADREAFTGYDKIVFSELTFDKFEVKSSGNTRIDRTWELTSEDKATYARYFKDEMLKIFSGANTGDEFGLGTGLNDRTLRVEFRLIKLAPYTAKHGEDVSGTISKQSVESFGALYVQILLVDSSTNRFVAVIEDGKELTADRPFRPVLNKSSDAMAWKRAFAGWLEDLKQTASLLKNGAQRQT